MFSPGERQPIVSHENLKGSVLLYWIPSNFSLVDSETHDQLT